MQRRPSRSPQIFLEAIEVVFIFKCLNSSASSLFSSCTPLPSIDLFAVLCALSGGILKPDVCHSYAPFSPLLSSWATLNFFASCAALSRSSSLPHLPSPCICFTSPEFLLIFLCPSFVPTFCGSFIACFFFFFL